MPWVPLVNEDDLVLTHHAHGRLGERGFSEADIAFVVLHGERLHREGKVFYVLGRRQMPRGRERSHRHLEGLTVVATVDNVVLTAYKNVDSPRKVRRKAPTGWSRRHHTMQGTHRSRPRRGTQRGNN